MWWDSTPTIEVSLHSRRDFADVMKVPNQVPSSLLERTLCWVSMTQLGESLNGIGSFLKEEIWSENSPAVNCLWGIHTAKTWEWPLGAENRLWLIASTKSRTSVPQTQGRNCANNLNVLGSGSLSSWASREDTVGWWLDFSLVRPQVEKPAMLCRHANHEIICIVLRH